jgi:hypothetical protein
MSGDLVTENGKIVLYYVFRSNKRTLEPNSNPTKRGAAELKVSVRPRLQLIGDYWMEHGTHGEIKTVGRMDDAFSTFEGAQAAFAKDGDPNPTGRAAA